MSQSAHELLSHISEHKRDVEGAALKELTTYRITLVRIIDQAFEQIIVLQEQKDIKTSCGTQAMELMMLEESVSEHKLRIQEVTSEITVLDLAIAQQKKKWADQHRKHKSHEKLYEQLKHKDERAMNHKNQMEQDDQFAAKLVNKRQVSS